MREIKPFNNNGSIQLRFTYGGKRFCFNPVPGGQYNNRRDKETAQAIAVQIRNDILARNFDTSLDRYRLQPKAPPKTHPKTLLELWDAWVETLDVTETTRLTYYRWTRVMIAKANPNLVDVTWIQSLNLSSTTLKERLFQIRSCCNWGISQGFLKVNPYQGVKAQGRKRKEIKPFTIDEIRLIITGFETLYPHYSSFVKFLLITGCRTSEAIGLRWQHVDLVRGELIIKESLPKDPAGNGYKRKRKGTKTGTVRYLKLPDHLRSLLEEIKPIEAIPDDLVFTSPRGKHIDGDTFRKNYWAKVLEYQGVEYRKPYCLRHTMASHGIEQGIPITGVAYLLGHSDTSMVMRHYGHMVNRPDLPDLPIK
ncbi:site-specific integrase [Nostoc sp. CENA543]|uniref:site-specific integrase n=1 Tax=Nostoc sp. CENA543 TaxID=1869241 RepID=UPI000CA22447|nr:site-specific integrase [Nostoc sp. CENA543]AUT00875.1 site-specific integrase [Nostoc sp. CENA543]